MIVTNVSVKGTAVILWGDPPADHIPWYPSRRIVLQQHSIVGYTVGAQRAITLRNPERHQPAVNVTIFIAGHSHQALNITIPCAASENQLTWEPINTELVSNVLAALDAAVSNTGMPSRLYEREEPF